MVAPEPVPPQMVSARSLPDGALQGMRQALNALGGGEDEADESEGRLRSRAASTSMVAALDAEELRRETQLWERMMYKSASQHKRAVHFQRMRGVTRHVRAVASLDVGAAAAALRDGLQRRYNTDLGVVITDSHNRAWRMGTIGSAIGCAGITVLDDSRGGEDIYGRTLQATLISRADALAGTATLMMGETTEKLPVVILRGLPHAQTLSDDPRQNAQLINRPLEEDMFR